MHSGHCCGYALTSDAHCHAYVCQLERRGIVHAIARHCSHLAHLLEQPHNVLQEVHRVGAWGVAVPTGRQAIDSALPACPAERTCLWRGSAREKHRPPGCDSTRRLSAGAMGKEVCAPWMLSKPCSPAWAVCARKAAPS